MPQKKYKLEENEPSCAMGSSAMANAKLRQVSLLVSQGRSLAEAVRSICHDQSNEERALTTRKSRRHAFGCHHASVCARSFKGRGPLLCEERPFR